jgi:ankyrin repeat protein
MAEAAFMKAARRGLKEPLKLLLDSGKANVKYLDEEGRSALMYAAMGGFEEAVELLREVGSDLSHADNNGQTAMEHAAFNGHTNVVKMLADANSSRAGALCSAAKGGQTGVMKRLIELKSDVNESYQGEYPLMLAVEGNHLETVRFLVTECACYDVSREGQSVLEVATSAGHADLVVLLLNWEPEPEPEPEQDYRMPEYD